MRSSIKEPKKKENSGMKTTGSTRRGEMNQTKKKRRPRSTRDSESSRAESKESQSPRSSKIDQNTKRKSRPKSSSKTKIPRKSASTFSGRSSHESKPAQQSKKDRTTDSSKKRHSKHRMIFANEAGYSLAVIAEKNRLTDFWIQEDRMFDQGTSGNIYRGIVSKVIPALNAAFVDIGLDKDGFLSFADLGPDILKTTKQGRRKSPKGKSASPLKEGETILVQVAKERMRDKGPSLTAKVSLPGRFVVFMPYSDAIRMSRMLTDKEKKRFRELVDKEFDLDGGLIFRTAAKGRDLKEIQLDLKYLTQTWKGIVKDFQSGSVPKRIHQELELFERILRDNFSADIDEIIIDHPRLKKRIVQFLKVVAPGGQFDRLIKFHTDKNSTVWSAYKLEKDIEQLFSHHVSLDCGGYIIIEEMETLVAIDVNTGKNIAGTSQEETIAKTNQEAAVEIARQLRLRQLGGIIVIDFIDMRLKRNRDRVFKVLEKELSTDRTPSDIQDFTDLGLIQVTRQRSGKSLTRRLTYTCPHCNGSGRRPSISLV